MNLDQWLFIKINSGLSHPLLDPFFLFLSDAHKIKWFAALMVTALILGCLYKFGKNSWQAVLFVIVSVGMADLLCYRVLKSNIDRERPFQNESFQVHVIKVGDAHGRSFPSNHSANSFAGASALSFLFPHLSYFFYAYAALVALSRVYVGVHYPLDVTAGAFLGLLVTFLIRIVFRKKLISFTGPKA